jgi:hypothetical protein
VISSRTWWTRVPGGGYAVTTGGCSTHRRPISALQASAIAGVLGHGDYPVDPDWPLALDAVRP